MQRLIRVVLLSIAIVMNDGAHAAGARTFTSQRFGYQLSVPRDWNIAVPPSDVPVLFNYDESKALPQGLIPEGGANIYVIPYEAVGLVTSARDLQDWIQINSRMWHTNVRTSRVASWSRDERLPQRITKVDADYERAPEDEALQSEINYYFVLRGAGFRLRMLYGKGDPRSSYFNSVIGVVLRSVRAL